MHCVLRPTPPRNLPAQDVAKEWTCSLLLADTAGMLHVYDWEAVSAARLNARLKMRIHDAWVHKIAHVKDAGGLISCADDGTLKVHTLGVHGELKLRYSLRSPTSKPILAFSYSAAHAALATCGMERCIYWWSLSIAEPINTLYGHAAAVCNVIIDDTNHQLISCDTDSVMYATHVLALSPTAAPAPLACN